MGLPQNAEDLHSTQSTTGGPHVLNNSLDQAVNVNTISGNSKSFNIASDVPYQNINTPVFDFGNPEWNDLFQASETLDPSISLPQGDGMDPYIGFDIPFWLGQDQYQDMLQDRN